MQATREINDHDLLDETEGVKEGRRVRYILILDTGGVVLQS